MPAIAERLSQEDFVPPRRRGVFSVGTLAPIMQQLGLAGDRYSSQGMQFVGMMNNETEQLMKQVAIGRKNWLFVGSVAAGERAADFLTIVSSALRNDLDVWAYVKELLDRLLAGDRDYAALRPDRWAAAHPDQIREYRVEERRDRAEAKQARGTDRRAAAPC